MSPVIASLRQKRWEVTLYGGDTVPAKVFKVKVLGGDADAAKEVAASFYPGFEAVRAVPLPWVREVVL